MKTYREQFASLAPNASAAIAVTGIWAQQVWIFWLNTSAAAAGSFFPWQAAYLVTGLAMLALAACAVASRPCERSLAVLDWGASAVCAGGTAVVAASFAGIGGSAAVGVAKIVATVGYAWLYLRWGAFYGHLAVRQAIAFLFSAGIAAAVLKFLLAPLPLALSASIAVVLPVFSCWSCRCALGLVRAADAEMSRPAPFFTRANVGALWTVAVVFVVFSLANASMLSFRAPGDSLGGALVLAATRLTDIALCAAILVFVFGFGRSFDFPRLWKIVFFALATDFLLELLWPDAGWQALFSGVSLNFIVLFVWLTLTDVARSSSFSPYLVFGVGWSCYALPFYVGSVVAGLLPLGESASSYITVLFYAVALVLAFCLESRNPNVSRIFSDLAQQKSLTPSDFADIDSRCQALGKAHGLTAREIEVMQLFCKGRTKAYIAETMYVTENTVRSHIKHLYTKLGVHSRKEIQELIDAY